MIGKTFLFKCFYWNFSKQILGGTWHVQVWNLRNFCTALFVFLMNKKCQGVVVLIWMWCAGGFIFLMKEFFFQIGIIDIWFSIFFYFLFVAYSNFENWKYIPQTVYIKWNKFLHKELWLDLYRIRRIMRFVILLKTLSFLILSAAVYYYFLLLFELEI